jgi:hypothetical protein
MKVAELARRLPLPKLLDGDRILSQVELRSNQQFRHARCMVVNLGIPLGQGSDVQLCVA